MKIILLYKWTSWVLLCSGWWREDALSTPNTLTLLLHLQLSQHHHVELPHDLLHTDQQTKQSSREGRFAFGFFILSR